MPSQEKPFNLYNSAVPYNQTNAARHPRREKGGPMTGHKFAVGQTLFFSPSIFEPATRKGSYRVVSLLPSDGGHNQYRLKCEADGHERVVREGQLALQ